MRKDNMSVLSNNSLLNTTNFKLRDRNKSFNVTIEEKYPETYFCQLSLQDNKEQLISTNIFDLLEQVKQKVQVVLNIDRVKVQLISYKKT